MSSSGVGAVHGAGAATAADALSAAGVGTLKGAGAAITAGIVSAAGVGTASFAGAAIRTVSGAFSAAGTGTASFRGSTKSAAVDKSGWVFGKRRKHYNIDDKEMAHVLANIAQRLAEDWADQEADGGIIYH